ncbi:hypothetical protein HY491_03530 [Candidatus Woesearchaeota archaeon]|nr:hypothetical protein [Candidatus Woesearchaeota archaeon]
MNAKLMIFLIVLVIASISLFAQQSPSLYGMLTINNIRIPDPAGADCYQPSFCADLNGDGIVNEIDLLGFSAKAGECTPAAAYLSSIDADANGCVEFCTGMPGRFPDSANDCTKANPSRDYACMFAWLGKRTNCNLVS